MRFHYNTMHLWRICHTPHESSNARKDQSSFKSFCLLTPCSFIQLSKSFSFLHQYLCQLYMSPKCGNRLLFYYLWVRKAGDSTLCRAELDPWCSSYPLGIRVLKTALKARASGLKSKLNVLGRKDPVHLQLYS